MTFKKVMKFLIGNYKKQVKMYSNKIHLSYSDNGVFESKMQIAGDMIVFNMHSNIFAFEEKHWIWENEYVKKHADEIESDEGAESKNGHQIIEALRSGVKLSTLDEFMNIDDFAILRPVFKDDVNNVLKKEALVMAFRQLGKKYDFNFDVNTTDKIVCSELAYVSFPSIDWPTEKTLGRHNISPDNVAKLAWNNLPLELVLFYHDGELVHEKVQLAKMKALMQE